MSRRFLIITAILCAASFAAPRVPLQAQTVKSRVNVKETPRVDPFAARANRLSSNASSASEEKTAQEPGANRANPSESVAPSANPAPTNSASKSAAPALANDVLTLRDGRVLRGELLALSPSAGATIRVDGQETRVPFEDALRAELAVSQTFLDAQNALDAFRRVRDLDEARRAVSLFQQARADASRSIEKEWATARRVEALLALGKRNEAALEFFILCRLDPYCARLDAIPLVWPNQTKSDSSASYVRARDAAIKILDGQDANSNSPVARLLAASILARDSQGKGKAAAALRELSVCEAPDGALTAIQETCRLVSLLALAQLWRDEILAGPKIDAPKRWLHVYERLPNELKSGPAYVMALGADALQLNDDALNYACVAALSPDPDVAKIFEKFASAEPDAASQATSQVSQ